MGQIQRDCSIILFFIIIKYQELQCSFTSTVVRLLTSYIYQIGLFHRKLALFKLRNNSLSTCALILEWSMTLCNVHIPSLFTPTPLEPSYGKYVPVRHCRTETLFRYLLIQVPLLLRHASYRRTRSMQLFGL